MSPSPLPQLLLQVHNFRAVSSMHIRPTSDNAQSIHTLSLPHTTHTRTHTVHTHTHTHTHAFHADRQVPPRRGLETVIPVWPVRRIHAGPPRPGRRFGDRGRCHTKGHRRCARHVPALHRPCAAHGDGRRRRRPQQEAGGESTRSNDGGARPAAGRQQHHGRAASQYPPTAAAATRVAIKERKICHFPYEYLPSCGGPTRRGFFSPLLFIQTFAPDTTQHTNTLPHCRGVCTQ